MVPALPKTFALKSAFNLKYLTYVPDNGMIQGFLKFSAEDLNSNFTKFEVVESKSGDEFVHIKCSHNNKYWRRWSSNLYWIAADADEPDENQSKWSCTLFKPVFVDGDDATTIQLRHVQLYRNAFSNATDYEPYAHCLSAAVKPREMTELDVFTIIDLAPVLPENEPSHFAFKRELDVTPREGARDVKVMQTRGLTDTPREMTEGARATVTQTRGLPDTRARPITISEGSKVAVKKYEIVDVEFDLNQAEINITDTEQIFAPIRNDGDETEERDVLFEYDDRMEYSSWKSRGDNRTTNEMDTNVVTELRSPVPFIFNEKTVLLGDEFTGPYKWGNALDSTSEAKIDYKTMIPPNTRLSIILKSKKANVTVPFSYTRRDIHPNGAVTPHRNLRGEFKGAKYLYNPIYEFNQVEHSHTHEGRQDLVE